MKEYAEMTMEQRKEAEMLEWKLGERGKELERKEGDWKKEKERVGKMWEDRFEALKRALSEEKQGLYGEIDALKREKLREELAMK